MEIAENSLKRWITENWGELTRPFSPWVKPLGLEALLEVALERCDWERFAYKTLESREREPFWPHLITLWLARLYNDEVCGKEDAQLQELTDVVVAVRNGICAEVDSYRALEWRGVNRLLRRRGIGFFELFNDLVVRGQIESSLSAYSVFPTERRPVTFVRYLRKIIPWRSIDILRARNRREQLYVPLSDDGCEIESADSSGMRSDVPGSLKEDEVFLRTAERVLTQDPRYQRRRWEKVWLLWTYKWTYNFNCRGCADQAEAGLSSVIPRKPRVPDLALCVLKDCGSGMTPAERVQIVNSFWSRPEAQELVDCIQSHFREGKSRRTVWSRVESWAHSGRISIEPEEARQLLDHFQLTVAWMLRGLGRNRYHELVGRVRSEPKSGDIVERTEASLECGKPLAAALVWAARWCDSLDHETEEIHATFKKLTMVMLEDRKDK